MVLRAAGTRRTHVYAGAVPASTLPMVKDYVTCLSPWLEAQELLSDPWDPSHGSLTVSSTGVLIE